MHIYVHTYQYKEEIYGISKSKLRIQVKYDEMSGTQSDNIWIFFSYHER